jgi:hypothetical protein
MPAAEQGTTTIAANREDPLANGAVMSLDRYTGKPNDAGSVPTSSFHTKRPVFVNTR